MTARRSSTSTRAGFGSCATSTPASPAGAPSLVDCGSLTVRGDVAFGAGVVVRGDVTIEHDGDGQRVVEDGAVLEG